MDDGDGVGQRTTQTKPSPLPYAHLRVPSNVQPIDFLPACTTNDCRCAGAARCAVERDMPVLDG